MEKQEKEFILNKGLMLGLVLLIFPFIDLQFGLNMSWRNYFLIFGLSWTLVYSFLLLKWAKEFASYYEVFPFKDTFRTLFVISALAFAVLTVGKTLLWTVSFQDTYIEINEKRELGLFSLQKNVIDEAYKNGTFNEDQYDDQIEAYNQNTSLVNQKWNDIRDNGIGTTYFLQILVSVLFMVAIYCAILSLFIRKKEKFIKTI
jgi:hypothetical protein